MEGPVSAVQRVFLDEVQIIHTGDLHAEETKKVTFVEHFHRRHIQQFDLQENNDSYCKTSHLLSSNNMCKAEMHHLQVFHEIKG